MAKKVGKFGITVNAVSPTGDFPEDPARDTSTGSRYHPSEGLITRAAQTRMDELMTLQRRHHMDRDKAKPSEIGAAAVFFASKHCAFTTGQTLYIEGGCLLTSGRHVIAAADAHDLACDVARRIRGEIDRSVSNVAGPPELFQWLIDDAMELACAFEFGIEALWRPEQITKLGPEAAR